MALIGKSSAYNVVTDKDDIGRPLVQDIAGWRPGGLTVAQSEDLTDTDAQRDFLVGDMTKAMLFLKRNLKIETGYDGNDFTEHMVTMRASLRGGFLVKNLEKFAFVKGDFVTAGGLLVL
jgi:HK97 family phage major capsid protein